MVVVVYSSPTVSYTQRRIITVHFEVGNYCYPRLARNGMLKLVITTVNLLKAVSTGLLHHSQQFIVSYCICGCY